MAVMLKKMDLSHFLDPTSKGPLSILDLPIRLLIKDSHLILRKHIHEILP